MQDTIMHQLSVLSKKLLNGGMLMFDSFQYYYDRQLQAIVMINTGSRFLPCMQHYQCYNILSPDYGNWFVH